MRVEEHVDVDARRKDVWAKLADTSQWPRLIDNVRQMEPDGEAEASAALGSRYRMRMHVGSADVGGLVEVVELDENRDLAWTSVTGIDQRGRWRLRDLDDGGTRITLRLSYGAPGGIVGALTERIAVGQVRTERAAGTRAAESGHRRRERRSGGRDGSERADEGPAWAGRPTSWAA